MRERIGRRELGGGKVPQDQTRFLLFVSTRSAAPATDWRAAAVMAQVSPVWKVFKIHASISTPGAPDGRLAKFISRIHLAKSQWEASGRRAGGWGR